MRFSIITPDHRGDYLKECWESLKSQTFQDFEWVIFPNGSLTIEKAKEFVGETDPRIVYLEKDSSYVENKLIGTIKNYAFSHGKGEIVIELDSDDLLLPTCLEKLDEAFKDEKVGFVYSNCAEFNKDWTSRPPYDPNMGWKWRDFSYQGHNLIEMISFEPSPQAMSLVWFAPNHVRAWRKSVYDAIGGHEKSLQICDDQDLLCRTYLVTEMKHINECLYLYRVHGDNSWLKYNADIQSKNWEVFHKYYEKLCLKWSKDHGLRALDVCGGLYPANGFESVDLEGGDIKADLNDKWPFADGSVGVVRAYDALEHMKDKQFTMSEIHRVLAPNGVLLSLTPSATGNGAFMDPTHVAYWVEQSFWYYTRAVQAQYIRNTSERFMVNCLSTGFPSDWHRENNISYITAFLTKVDPSNRLPGALTI